MIDFYACYPILRLKVFYGEPGSTADERFSADAVNLFAFRMMWTLSAVLSKRYDFRQNLDIRLKREVAKLTSSECVIDEVPTS